jgi:hypothetical protein
MDLDGNIYICISSYGIEDINKLSTILSIILEEPKGFRQLANFPSLWKPNVYYDIHKTHPLDTLS